MLVDLFTTSRNLQDLIISEYPEKIGEEQISIDSSLDKRVYCFLDLNYQVIKGLLEKVAKNHAYELRDSETGDIVKTNNQKEAKGTNFRLN